MNENGSNLCRLEAFPQPSRNRLDMRLICAICKVDHQVRFAGSFLDIGKAGDFDDVDAKVLQALSRGGRSRRRGDLVFRVLGLEPDEGWA